MSIFNLYWFIHFEILHHFLQSNTDDVDADDHYVLSCAKKWNGVVISNDRYKDHLKKTLDEKMKLVIRER